MISINISNLQVENKLVIKSAKAEIKQGEFVAITGKSGCGKSSLINAICNLNQKYEGKISLLGIDNKKLNNKSMRILLRDQISLVMQDNGLVLNETVMKNMLYVPRLRKKKSLQEITRALQLVNLKEDILKQKVQSLSGGEQQRVALAKAMLKHSKIIICDEPTGNLDVESANQVYKILRNLASSGVTICIVSHDVNINKYADKVYYIDNKVLH